MVDGENGRMGGMGRIQYIFLLIIYYLLLLT